MGTNKHKQTREKKSKPSATKKEAAEEGPSDTAAPRSLVSTPQLNALIMLAISIQYLLQMRLVLYESKDCNAYLHPSAQQEAESEGQSCSHTDLLLLMAKVHSGTISEILVALIMVFLCWFDSSLLLQFQAILCTSPLLTSVLALQATKSAIDPGFAGKLSMMVTILLVLVAVSLYSAKNISPRQPIKVNVANATLFTIMVAFAWETYKFLQAGVPGFINFFEEQKTSPASFILMAFLAVDQATLVGICLFGIIFLTDSPKRVSLILHTVFVCQCHLNNSFHYREVPLGLLRSNSFAFASIFPATYSW